MSHFAAMTAGLIKQLHLLPRLGTFAVPAVCDIPQRDPGGCESGCKRSRVPKSSPGRAWGSPPFLSSCCAQQGGVVLGMAATGTARKSHSWFVQSLPSSAGVAAPFIATFSSVFQLCWVGGFISPGYQEQGDQTCFEGLFPPPGGGAYS